MAVNHPYTFITPPKMAYISYSKEMLPAYMRCKHSFSKILLKSNYPSEWSKCEKCDLMVSDAWVWAWSLGLV